MKDDTGAPLGMEEQYRGEMDEMETEFALSKQMTAGNAFFFFCFWFIRDILHIRTCVLSLWKV